MQNFRVLYISSGNKFAQVSLAKCRKAFDSIKKKKRLRRSGRVRSGTMGEEPRARNIQGDPITSLYRSAVSRTDLLHSWAQFAFSKYKYYLLAREVP